MPKIINLRRWHPRTFSYYGEEIELEIKALERHEAPAFVRRMTALGEAWQASVRPDGDGLDLLKHLEDPELVDAFRSFVRIAPGQEITWEGQAATPEILYREGNPWFVMAVMTAIQRLAMLTMSEGKVFGSRSGSRSVASAPENSVSDAPSTESGSGTEPSTATPSIESAPSSAESRTD